MEPGLQVGSNHHHAGNLTSITTSTTAFAGNLKGYQVAAAADGTASIQDSLEELSLTMGEASSKKLADRSIRSKSFSARLHALMAKYVTALPETLSPDELKHQYAEWLRHLAQPDSQRLKHRLQERFGDNEEAQVATLEFLDELFTEEENPAAKAAIRDLKNEWKQDVKLGPLIRAGENVATTAEEFSGELDSDFGLKTFYRTTVLGWSTLDDAYTSVLDSYGGESFSSATEFLIRALGCEMQSMGPSCDPRLLAAVRDDIYYLQVVRRLHFRLEELVERLQSNYGNLECRPKSMSKRRKKSSEKSSHSKTSDGLIPPPL